MSHIDFKSKKTDKERARKLVAEIVGLRPRNVLFSRHAEIEMLNDGLTQLDVWNVLKSGSSRIVDEGELVNGSYRYRLQTNFIAVVIAFWPDGEGLIVVTVWDKRKSGRR